MDDVVTHLVRLSPWDALNALGRVNKAASVVARKVDPSQFGRLITRMCVDMQVLPNGVMHGIAAYNNKRHVSMACDRGRALSIRVTEWRHPSIEIDLQRSLIITSHPPNYVGNTPTISIECASGARLLFDHGRCTSAYCTPLFSARSEDVDGWIATNMHSFDARTRAALTDRAPDRLIRHITVHLWLGGESLDRMCALMTSPCPTPTLMRHR